MSAIPVSPHGGDEVTQKPAAALQISGLSKTFPGQRALSDVQLSLEPGEVRALVGENGCGKSTLVKVLSGYHEPDPGAEVLVNGEPLRLGVDGAGDHAGLRFVHQDLGLVLDLDSCDNLAMGHGYERNKMRLISWRREAQLARGTLCDLGYDIDVRQPTGHLAISERTAIALARALSPRATPPRVLVLDEPTANLPAAEIDQLFKVIRSAKEQGVAVLLISHHLDEVFAICDTVTVLRDGRHVITRDVQGLDEDSLVALMIGRKLEQFQAAEQAIESHRTEATLVVRGLHAGTLQGIDLDVHAGEVVGIAGITGSGREEIALALFGGIDRTGKVSVNGTAVTPHRPDKSVEAGLGLVPAERHVNAAFLDSTLRENVSILSPGDFRRRGLISRRREVSDVTSWLRELNVKPADPEQGLATLSGGNQQKVMLARWLRQRPTVLVLDEPTQGVDIGAKAEIHTLVDQAAGAGAAVVVVSTAHAELTRLAHRVLVLRGGRITDELSRPHIDPDRITAATIGAGRGEQSNDKTKWE
jgi:ribose transport system ATP-binding protein